MVKRRLSVRTPGRDSCGSSKRARRLLPSSSIDDGDTNTLATRDAVLNTTELLERILAHLPSRKIFVIQGVSKHWKKVISTSPDIQETLFLRPTPPERPREIWELVDAQFNRVRVLTKTEARLYAGDCDPRRLEQREGDAVRNHAPVYLLVALNPMMERSAGSFLTRHTVVGLDEPGVAHTIKDTRHERVSYEGTMALLEQNASMYLTNPPTCEAYIDVTVFYRDADAPSTTPAIKASLSRIVVESSKGLKIQDIVEGAYRGESISCFVFTHDNSSLYGGGTLDRLRNDVREKRNWRRAIRDPIIYLDITLQGSGSAGSLPMVPTAEERRAVIKS
jgi:hypothetical protein